MAGYAAVVWTTGDVITETKLDNMVSNDQSEDAHAANGMIMNNNVAYSAKQAGGATKDVMKLGTDDILRLSQLRYQEDNADSTGNSTEENVVIQFGWGQVVGDGSGKILNAITFPTAFGATPLYISANYIGTKSGAGANIAAFVATHGTGTTITASARSPATTGMTVDIHRSDGGTLSAANRFAYSWIAIGVTA